VNAVRCLLFPLGASEGSRCPAETTAAKWGGRQSVFGANATRVQEALLRRRERDADCEDIARASCPAPKDHPAKPGWPAQEPAARKASLC